MVTLMIGMEKVGNKIKIKSEIMDLLKKGNQVCVLCLKRDLKYYQDMRWRSLSYHIHDVKQVKAQSPLTLLYIFDDMLWEDVNEQEIIDFEIMINILEKDFDYIFIDNGQHILQNFINSHRLDQLITLMNSEFKQTQIVIAIQSLKQLYNDSLKKHLVKN